VAVARKIGEPIKVPDEIDVIEEDDKIIHSLTVMSRSDVTEVKDKIEILEIVWEKMADAVLVEAQKLKERWST
jgi:hypothetical protein